MSRVLTRFYVTTGDDPDGKAVNRFNRFNRFNRYAIMDALGDGYPACVTIGAGWDDPRYTMLTLENAERVAAELNAEDAKVIA